MLEDVGLTRHDRLMADSAEPKSIADYRKYGLNCVGVRKGAGSVERGFRFLQSLTKIVVDNNRCPNTVRELLEYEYERTKDGEIINGYPDGKDHQLSCLRYALEPVYHRAGQTGKAVYTPIYMNQLR